MGETIKEIFENINFYKKFLEIHTKATKYTWRLRVEKILKFSNLIK